MSINFAVQFDRSSFLDRYFHDSFFDFAVFAFADRMLKGYSGGMWDFLTAESDNGTVPFIAPSVESESVTLKNIFSGDEVSVDVNLAGMILTSYALEYQINNKSRRDLFDIYDGLRDAICQYCSDIKRMDVWMAIMD